MNLSKGLFSFKGRIRRRDFVKAQCILFLVEILLYLLTFTVPFGIVIIVSFLILQGISFILAVKRFQDVNLTGLLAVLIFTPAAFLIYPYLFFKKGSYGDNHYGKDPKAIETTNNPVVKSD